MRLARLAGQAASTAATSCTRSSEAGAETRVKVIRDRRCRACWWSSPSSTATPRGFFLETWRARELPRRRHRRRRSCRTTTRARRRGTLRGLHAQLDAPAGQAGARDRGRDLRRRRRRPPRLADLRALGGRTARRRQLPPALGAARLRARLLRAVGRRRRSSTSAPTSTTATTRSPSRGTIPTSPSSGRSTDPLLSAKDRDAPRLRDLEPAARSASWPLTRHRARAHRRRSRSAAPPRCSTASEVERQLALLADPPPPLELVAAATASNGIELLAAGATAGADRACGAKRRQAGGCASWCPPRAPPAACSRACRARSRATPTCASRSVRERAERGDATAKDVAAFASRLRDFPFRDALAAAARGALERVEAGDADADVRPVLAALLRPEGLGFAGDAQGPRPVPSSRRARARRRR